MQQVAAPPTWGRTILALDLGTVTGWAMQTSPITSGSVSFKNGRYEGGGMRFLRFKSWLTDLHRNEPIGLIFFEEVRRHAGTDAAHVYGGLLGILTAWCEERDIPYSGTPVGTIKKHATGKGNASKQMMIDAARQRGHVPGFDNEADALALLYLSMEAFQG